MCPSPKACWHVRLRACGCGHVNDSGNPITLALSRGVRKRGNSRRLPSASSRTYLEVRLATRWYEEMSVGAGSSGSSSRSSTVLIDLVQNASLRIFSHCAVVSTHWRTAAESLGSKQLRRTGQPRAAPPAASVAPDAPAALHRPLDPLAAASASTGDGGMGGGGMGGGGGGRPPSCGGIATTSAGGFVSSAVATAPPSVSGPNSQGGTKPLTCRS